VGKIFLLDRDIVEWSNLQRQCLFSESDAELALSKAHAAAHRLRQINSQIELIPQAIDLHAGNIQDHLNGITVVMDGSDNFAVRYLLNDWCVRESIPLIYAGAVDTYGMTGAVLPGEACLRCTWLTPPQPGEAPTCRTAGVLGSTISLIAATAVTEAIKLIVGDKDSIFPGYRYFDSWENEARGVHSKIDPDCPCCQKRDFQYLKQAGSPVAQTLCGGGTVQLPSFSTSPLDLQAISKTLKAKVENLSLTPQLLRFESGDLEIFCFADGRTLVRGTEDLGRARSIVARTLGLSA
jgi:adenylyltransferase/sulfurtransferase